jgi:xylose isomerase
MAQYFGPYDSNIADDLKKVKFDRTTLGKRGLSYEKLDQLTVELLMGV